MQKKHFDILKFDIISQKKDECGFQIKVVITSGEFHASEKSQN